MIVVTGHIRIAPDKIEALRPAMRTVLETTRKERGCLLYAYGEDVLDPGLLRIVERWESWETLEAHSKNSHMKPWRDAIAAVGGAIERNVVAQEAGEPKTL
ncbi:MAG: antibiotic biosynthesis monooxygenase [Hyphomicrobiaceae bacterium]|nr:antibiotic biosynthesis monooxygenase [Hyphomicrobiaceae bacterium]